MHEVGPMSPDAVDEAVRRSEARRPDLGRAIQQAAEALTAGQGIEMIHQAWLQQFLWWVLPRRYPEDEWNLLVEATTELLDELGLARLSRIARSGETMAALDAWAKGSEIGAAVFRDVHGSSGVEPPDTVLLAWGSIMGIDEARALESVERALADAIDAGRLVPGASRWRLKAAAITQDVLGRELDLPPGQTLAGLVTTERNGTWIDSARHPLHREWRSSVANRLLHRIEPPDDPAKAIEPMWWLLGVAADGGAELTQSNYLARATVVAAVDRFGWWDWPKAPHSEADVHQLSTLRAAAGRLRLVRRRGRRLYATTHGKELIKDPRRLWEAVSSETEDGEDFSHTVTELVGLRLLHGQVVQRELAAEIAPILAAQGWSSDEGPITEHQAASAIWRPLRWWGIFGALDVAESTHERGTFRELTPRTNALTPEGVRMALAYLRARAAGPRTQLRE